MLPLLSFFKQILHPVSAVNGSQITGLESLVGKGFWNQRWNVSQEKLFGVIIKKDAPLFCFKFWLRSIYIKNYYTLEEDVWIRFPETVNQNHAEQKSILGLKKCL